MDRVLGSFYGWVLLSIVRRLFFRKKMKDEMVKLMKKEDERKR